MVTTVRSLKKKPLGQGISALLGPDLPQEKDQLKEVSLDRLIPGKYQPRKTIAPTALQELADSIKENGVIQPIVVRELGDRYEIIAGERRWRASKLAQLETVPIVIKDLDDKQSLEMALLENIQREDLDPMEESLGYQRLMEEFSYTQETLSKILGKSRSHIANLLRLQNLPEALKIFVREGKLSAGHARALLGHPHPEEAAKTVIRQGLNVRQTEALCQNPEKQKSKTRAQTSSRSDELPQGELGQIAQTLSEQLNLPVGLKSEGKGGKIEIQFNSFEELDRFLSIVNDGTEKVL